MFKTSIVAACLLACAGAAWGQPAFPIISYDTPNGDGQASGGTFNYWDGTYQCIFSFPCSPAGSTMIDNAPLFGGSGALTDGVVATQRWDQVSNVQGTGQYVGWNWRVWGDPTLVFRTVVYADPASPIIGTVSLAVDDSGFGGVFAPLGIVINGVFHTPTVTAISPTAEWLAVSGLNLPGPFVSITPVADPRGYWDFLSEVQFTVTPEPATWTMMALGFGLIGGLGSELISGQAGIHA